MHKFLLIPLLMTLFTFVNAEEKELSDIEKIHAAISKHKKINGNFKQAKEIKKLDLTLISRGTFEMTGKNFVWNQKTPISGRYEINEKGMNQKVADQPEESISRSKAPEVAMMSDMMICILSGNQTCLNKNFKISNIDAENLSEWKFTLTPKDKFLRKLMGSMKIKGNRSFVKEVEILEKQGNSTIISFYKVRGE